MQVLKRGNWDEVIVLQVGLEAVIETLRDVLPKPPPGSAQYGLGGVPVSIALATVIALVCAPAGLLQR